MPLKMSAMMPKVKDCESLGSLFADRKASLTAARSGSDTWSQKVT